MSKRKSLIGLRMGQGGNPDAQDQLETKQEYFDRIALGMAKDFVNKHKYHLPPTIDETDLHQAAWWRNRKALEDDDRPFLDIKLLRLKNYDAFNALVKREGGFQHYLDRVNWDMADEVTGSDEDGDDVPVYRCGKDVIDYIKENCQSPYKELISSISTQDIYELGKKIMRYLQRHRSDIHKLFWLDYYSDNPKMPDTQKAELLGTYTKKIRSLREEGLKLCAEKYTEKFFIIKEINEL